MSTAALFERLAPRYDELWTDTPIGRAQRDAVWRLVDGLFHAGDRVLDIGCGTGEDAAHLTSRGVSVYATDATPAMVKMARARGVDAVVWRAEDLRQMGDVFDGALSNFGALNCVEDVAAVARDLAPLVRPRGYVAICTMGRFCAWEMLSRRRALRRLNGRAGDVRYPTVRQLTRAFAPAFELIYWAGVGMFVPPSYVRLPAPVVRVLAHIDRIAPLRFCADHRLLVFRRK